MSFMYKNPTPRKTELKEKDTASLYQPPFLSPSPAPYLLPLSDACLHSSGLFGHLPGDLTAILLSSDIRGK